MTTPSSVLWRKAHDALSPKDKTVIPPNFATKPEDLIPEVEKYISQSKGRPIKLPNGENLFVRDVLQKVSRWIKKFVEIGDTVVQYDPGHAALPWALLRLVLQMSMNNIEDHAAVLEGVEQMSYYLVWSKIEESSLTIPFEAHDQLELVFIQLYTKILTFTARSLRFLRNKPHRIVKALFSSGSKFQNDVEQMARQKQSIESYVQQISNQTNQKQYSEIMRVKDQLADLHQPVVRIEQTIQSISTVLDRTENQRILNWTSEIPYQKHFKMALEKALVGTGSWLFQDPEFSAWQNCSRSQMLWLHGNAGSGKSTLISMVIQSLIEAHKQQQAAYPIYFFCSRNTAEPERADPEHILRSLTRQASDLPGGPPLHQILRDRFDKSRVQGDVSAEEASEIIINTIESRPITYIMVDALDECDRRKREVLVDSLKTILTKSDSLVKIFVTSRDNHQDIVWSMNGFPALCIDASRNQADIVQYVQYSVQRAIDKRKLLPTERMTADVQQAVVDSLCKGADGMFRWVELQLEYLYTIRKTSILLKRLERLPPGLEKIYKELYEYNIQELGEEQADVVKKILSWLLVSMAPLCTSELCQLVCAPEEADMSVETVLDMTFDLVRLDTEQDQFRFSHLSVREFLEKRKDEFGQGLLNSMATRTCVDLLTSLEVVNAKHYAALYWPVHAEEATRKGHGTTIKQQLDEFLVTRNSHFRKWNIEMFQLLDLRKRMYKSPIGFRLRSAVVESDSSLLIAACFNLSTQLLRIISDAEHPVDIELKNQDGAGALCLASRYGAVESARVLLENGADVNAQGGAYYGTALCTASEHGHEELVQILLERCADINAQGGFFGTALYLASYHGHEKVVKMLLERGADVNAQGRYYGTALQAASMNGYEKVVQLLLDKGANVNAQGRGRNAALHAASSRGHEKIVQLLLDRNADIDAQGGDGTALEVASRSDHGKIVQMLLNRGAKVNAQGESCGSMLTRASYHGHFEVVQMLLDRGVDVNFEASNGTALQVALSNGHEQIVQILRQHGAREEENKDTSEGENEDESDDESEDASEDESED